MKTTQNEHFDIVPLPEIITSLTLLIEALII